MVIKNFSYNEDEYDHGCDDPYSVPFEEYDMEMLADEIEISKNKETAALQAVLTATNIMDEIKELLSLEGERDEISEKIWNLVQVNLIDGIVDASGKSVRRRQFEDGPVPENRQFVIMTTLLRKEEMNMQRLGRYKEDLDRCREELKGYKERLGITDGTGI